MTIMQGDADPLSVARQLRPWLIGIVAACVAASVLVAVVMRPVYRAEVIVLPVSPEGDMNLLASVASQLGALGSLAGIEIGGDTVKVEALATIRSRAFTEQFITEKGLLPRLYEDDWDAGSKQWTVDEDDVPTMWEAQKMFDEDIRRISENRRTGLVTIAVEWTDPREAAEWANDLVARANLRLREQAIRESRKSLNYLSRELESTDVVALREAVFRLVETQTRRIMVANVREDYAFKVIDPATPPDADDYVRPKPAVLILLGLFGGLAMALAFVLVVSSVRRRRAAA